MGVRRLLPEDAASFKAIIRGMYANPDCRRHGLGRKLVTAALEYASAELGAPSVNLGVTTTCSNTHEHQVRNWRLQHSANLLAMTDRPRHSMTRHARVP